MKVINADVSEEDIRKILEKNELVIQDLGCLKPGDGYKDQKIEACHIFVRPENFSANIFREEKWVEVTGIEFETLKNVPCFVVFKDVESVQKEIRKLRVRNSNHSIPS